MRIIVVGLLDMPPDERNAALIRNVVRCLEAPNHELEAVAMPQPILETDTMEHSLAMRLFDLGIDAEHLITLGGHTHLLSHPNKTILVSETDPMLSLAASDCGGFRNEYIRQAFQLALQESRQVIAASPKVATLLKAEFHTPVAGIVTIGGSSLADLIL